MKKPLIVQVVRQYWPNIGGLENVVRNLSVQLLAAGFRVRVVTLDRLFQAREQILPAFEMHDGVEIIRVPWFGSSRYPLAPSFFRHIGDADFIHVHGVDFFFDALALTRLLHGKPMVATSHGGFFHTSAHGRLKRIWFNTMTRLNGHAYGRIICCSQSDYHMFAKLYPERLCFLENGVDVQKFAGLAGVLRQKSKRLLTIGRFSQNKRLDLLLDMMRAALAEQADWHLDIAGTGSDLSAGDVIAMIEARGLSAHVTLHMDADDAYLRDLVENASLFVSASHYEGFGLVAVEAMSGGLLPVLHQNEAYQALGSAHGDLVISDFSNPKIAAQAVFAAHARLEREGQMLRARLEAQAKTYSWAAVAAKTIDIYHSLGLALPESGSFAGQG